MHWWVLVVVLAGGCDRLFKLDEFSHHDAAGSGSGSDAPVVFDDAPLVPNGLVALYPMEDVATGVVADVSGHGHDAHCSPATGTCPAPVSGVKNHALQFDGQMNRIDVIAGGELETVTGFTVTAWLRIDEMPVTTAACPLGKPFGPADLNSWQLCISPIALPDFITESGQGLDELYGPLASAFVVGMWNHIALTMDPGGTKSLWFNGAQVASHSAAMVVYDQSPITFGADRDSGSIAAQLAGAIDEIRIYNRALTQSEIQLLAQP